VEPGRRRRVESDRVEIGRRELQESIRAAEQQATLEREEKLKDLEKAIADGTYRPDPHRLAEEVLRSALLLARLRALL
jgi:anti-sigma28 factor (negative regulator of flagellin synthesis)